MLYFSVRKFYHFVQSKMFNLKKAVDAQRIVSENKRIGSPFVNCVTVEKKNDSAQACEV
jgi:hypothetical protein